MTAGECWGILGNTGKYWEILETMEGWSLNQWSANAGSVTGCSFDVDLS